MQDGERSIKLYVAKDGTSPFDEWLDDLRDPRVRAVVQVRIDRLKAGNPGLYRFLGQGLFELKIDRGPGYRVYYGEHGAALVILLCGGDKKTQGKDIASARSYWEDFKRRI